VEHRDGPVVPAHDWGDDVGTAAKEIEGIGLVEVVEGCVTGE
jgi:hypothetical protein